MHITARHDYAVQAMLVVAAAGGRWVTTAEMAAAQDIPFNYLQSILFDLRRARLLSSRPGVDGGYALGRKADKITVAEIMRAADGVLSSIRGRLPETISYAGPALVLTGFWASIHSVVGTQLDKTTLQDLLTRAYDELA